MDCNKTQNDFLAVVGMACRFPGAASLEEFWENLLAGRQAMSPVGEQALNAGPHKNVWRLPGYVRMCCRLEDVEFFDPDFFGLSTAEAEIMDPQHRLLLETAWRALENSGDTRPDAEKTRTGVYASVNISSYMLGNLYSHMLTGTLDPFEVLLGNDKDYLATRIARPSRQRPDRLLIVDGRPAYGLPGACFRRVRQSPRRRGDNSPARRTWLYVHTRRHALAGRPLPTL